MERTLGTLIGGVLGYFAVIFNRSITLTDNVIFGPLSSAAVAAVGVLVGRALRLEYSAKLFCMTYILVLMGADEATGEPQQPLQIPQGLLPCPRAIVLPGVGQSPLLGARKVLACCQYLRINPESSLHESPIPSRTTLMPRIGPVAPIMSACRMASVACAMTKSCASSCSRVQERQ